ncbi:uncharacterized protein LOC134743851 [Cydia strobilella]|uniref:uncharacterized protein LOC134743851 n=1 Tax=Cydia strobilella TaxID=1100964 RepID=UPI0030049C17
MEKKPRLRAPNFTQSDNLLLCDVVSKYIHIIENKKTDGASLLQKQRAWLDVAEDYNSSTTGCSRTAESLQQTYKNLKKRAKKNASDEKMNIPVDPSLVLNIEKCGTSSQNCDWGEVSLNTGALEETCKEMFAALNEEADTSDMISKTAIMDTGGGPPLNADKDPVLEKVKALTGPVMDGIHTIYNGDNSLIASQNIPPIELHSIGSDSTMLDMQETQDYAQDNETYFTNNSYNGANFKKRPHHLLTRKRKLETESKQIKMELLEQQKELVKTQLQEELDRVEHNRMLRGMEMEDAKQKYIHNEKLREMEMEEMKRRNEFNEKMRHFQLK